jgi:hypothetical protein
LQREVSVKVPRSEVLDASENVKAEMRRKLDEIASLTKAHLAIVGQAFGSIGFGLETERIVEIVITGSYESVEQARVRLLVLLDELVSLDLVVVVFSILLQLMAHPVRSPDSILKSARLTTNCTISSLAVSDA